MSQSAAIIIGAGDATGGAIARAFAAEGLTACVNRRERNADQLEALAQSIRDAGHRARAFPADARNERPVGTLVIHVGQGDLFHIVRALHPGCRLPDLLYGREQKSNQDGNDGNHDQQFNQGKPLPGVWLYHEKNSQRNPRGEMKPAE